MKHFACRILLVTSLFSESFVATAQWVQVTTPDGYARSLAAIGSKLFAGTSGNGVLVSTDTGTTWNHSSLTGITYVRSFLLTSRADAAHNLWAATREGLFLSGDSGETWTLINSAMTNEKDVSTVAVTGSDIFVGNNWGIYRSTDGGATWLKVKGQTGAAARSIAVARASSGDTIIIAATYGNGLWRSTDRGTTWSKIIRLGSNKAACLASVGPEFVAGLADGRSYRSTNGGTSWIEIGAGLATDAVWGLYVHVSSAGTGAAFLLAATGHGAFFSADTGRSWSSIGLADQRLASIMVSTGQIFAGGDYGGLWRRPLSEILALIPPPPVEFSLEQNYPNPFNSGTVIRFSLARAGFATLKIYDVLGREVASLVSGRLDAGSHFEGWTAAGVGSGIYFCRLRAEGFVDTKKLILLR